MTAVSLSPIICHGGLPPQKPRNSQQKQEPNPPIFKFPLKTTPNRKLFTICAMLLTLSTLWAFPQSAMSDTCSNQALLTYPFVFFPCLGKCSVKFVVFDIPEPCTHQFEAAAYKPVKPKLHFSSQLAHWFSNQAGVWRARYTTVVISSEVPSCLLSVTSLFGFFGRSFPLTGILWLSASWLLPITQFLSQLSSVANYKRKGIESNSVSTMEVEDQLSSTEPFDFEDKETAATEVVSKKKDLPLRLEFGNGPRIHRQLCIEYGVVGKRCGDCGKVGQLTCFSPSFRKWALKRVTEEELHQTCSRCKERGHTCVNCDLPIIPKLAEAPARKERKPVHCGFCGEVGHNRRTCPRAV
ncbi:hypothetical protein VNO77_20909 [Canavalia gladiata]|uniref:CCHC-type domain-containing protein n=1 Tax=Canavalia gladiata TaxID=3824 RepID=A0AAN9LQZ9_CANGL